MCGSRSATAGRRPTSLRRAERERAGNADPVTSPPLPVPGPGLRRPASPPGAGLTFLGCLLALAAYSRSLSVAVRAAEQPTRCVGAPRGRRLAADARFQAAQPFA